MVSPGALEAVEQYVEAELELGLVVAPAEGRVGALVGDVGHHRAQVRERGGHRGHLGLGDVRRVAALARVEQLLAEPEGAAAEGVQDRLVKNGIRLEIRAAPDIGTFVADERRVRQSLFNLLANAVGFSPAGETVTLAALRLAEAVVLSVTDRGPGIPADVQEKVFDWFETHAQGSRHRGTGLGLSLVRSFVELHGGSVSLESAVGRGTTVTCVFPVKHRAERSAA